MYANYHTHTELCKHATGSMEDYVKEAIKNGLQVLGFSDHNPVIFSTGYVSWHRMTPEEIDFYVSEVIRLREKYKDKIKIHLGFEVEYYPNEFDGIMKILKKYPYEYLILGLHYLNNEYDGAPIRKASTEEDLICYVNQIIEGLKTGLFSYLAHPDIVGFTGDFEIYKREMIKICRTAKEMDIPLEFNILGFREGRNYPYERFWEIVAEVGNQVIIGSDAHRVQDVGEPCITKKAEEFLKRYNIIPIKELKFRKV